MFCIPGSTFHDQQKLGFFDKSLGFAHLAQPFLKHNHQKLYFFVKSFRFCTFGSTFHNHYKLGFFVKPLGFAHLDQPFLRSNHQKLCFFVKTFMFCAPGLTFHDHQKLQAFCIPQPDCLSGFLPPFLTGSIPERNLYPNVSGSAHLAQTFITIRNLVSLLNLQALHTWLTFLNAQSLETWFLC